MCRLFGIGGSGPGAMARPHDVRRETIPAGELILATECGGSDGNSGITANPAVGVAADLMVADAVERAGHGELLILLGLCLAVGAGAETFNLVGLKPDLGALIVGLTLANHRRAPELAERLLGFKDILLIGFFLSIGLDGAPGGAELLVAAVVLLLLPLIMLAIQVIAAREKQAFHRASILIKLIMLSRILYSVLVFYLVYFKY